jgi:hypothetical protein
MPRLALPQTPRWDEGNIGTTTGRTRHAFRPTPRNKIIQAVVGIREIRDCFQKALWLINVGFHASIVREIV